MLKTDSFGTLALALLVAIQSEDLLGLQRLLIGLGTDPDLDTANLWRRVRQFLTPADLLWLHQQEDSLRNLSDLE